MSNITISKEKNKHLSLEQYEFIINRVCEFDALHKGQKRNTGRTQFMKELSSTVNTSLSNLYDILRDARITVLGKDMVEMEELSATAAFNRRSRFHKVPNNSKLESASDFIDLVIDEVKSKKLSSIDETVNYLKIHCPDRIEGMVTVCTKTIYNYVHQGKVELKPIDLPRMVSRRNSKNYKTYIPGSEKGRSISERPEEANDRSEFGHWEGDLVTGPRDGVHGAYLTLVERQTRELFMIPIKSKSATNVYRAINKIEKFYGEFFSDIFKSITFDNGNEFSRWRDIEVRRGTNHQRTTVYFGRPYRSCDRASNENCNGLIRYFIKKGTDINTVPRSLTFSINRQINEKKRKIHGYVSSESLFIKELKKLGMTDNFIFYESLL